MQEQGSNPCLGSRHLFCSILTNRRNNRQENKEAILITFTSQPLNHLSNKKKTRALESRGMDWDWELETTGRLRINCPTAMWPMTTPQFVFCNKLFCWITPQHSSHNSFLCEWALLTYAKSVIYIWFWFLKSEHSSVNRQLTTRWILLSLNIYSFLCDFCCHSCLPMAWQQTWLEAQSYSLDQQEYKCIVVTERWEQGGFFF